MPELGHGKSDRLEAFPAELWIEEARQTIVLLGHLNLDRANLHFSKGEPSRSNIKPVSPPITV